MGSCNQGICDEVMQSALQISSSQTGCFKTSATVLDNQNRWSRIMGLRSVGRWAVGSTRTVATSELSDNFTTPTGLARSQSYYGDVGEVGDTAMLVTFPKFYFFINFVYLTLAKIYF
jgi:hypothetical protein